MEQIIQLDKKVTGEDRFIQLENHLENSYIYQNNNIVEGYYLPSLGEGLIIASNSLAGVELMKLRLTKINNAVFPIDNKVAIKFLYENNYKEFLTTKRMRWGNKINWQPQNIYNRIGGNLG